MPIHLHLKDYLAMVRHARDMAPVEDCGLIGGRIDGEDKIIEKVFYLTNVDHSEEHFPWTPKNSSMRSGRFANRGWSCSEIGTAIRQVRRVRVKKIKDWPLIRKRVT